jgi:hypothetical protein
MRFKPFVSLGLLVATVGALTVAPVAASATAPSAKQCHTMTRNTNFKAAGIKVNLYTNVTYAVKQGKFIAENRASFDGSAGIASATKRTVKSVGVLFMQFDDASQPWTHSMKFNFTAKPKNSASQAVHEYLGYPKNYYRFYGRKVRFIVNAQKHNFVGPWLTMGKGISCEKSK